MANTTELLATAFPAAVRDAALLFNQAFVQGLSHYEFEAMMDYLPWEQKNALSLICGFNGRQGRPLADIGARPGVKAVPLSFSRRVVSGLKRRLKSLL